MLEEELTHLLLVSFGCHGNMNLFYATYCTCPIKKWNIKHYKNHQTSQDSVQISVTLSIIVQTMFSKSVTGPLILLFDEKELLKHSTVFKGFVLLLQKVTAVRAPSLTSTQGAAFCHTTLHDMDYSSTKEFQ